MTDNKEQTAAPAKVPAVKKETPAKKSAPKKVAAKTAPAKKVAAKTASVKKAAPAKKTPVKKNVTPATRKAAPAVLTLTPVLKKLIEWQGSQAELARVAGVSRVAVTRWLHLGVVGRESSFVLAGVIGCPVTQEKMRPDVKNLPPENMGRVKDQIKLSNAYIKERDRERAAEEKAAAKANKGR